MFVIVLGLVVAVLLLWSRVTRLEERLAAREAQDGFAPAHMRATEPPHHEPGYKAAPRSGTVTIVNRPPTPLVVEPDPVVAPEPALEPAPIMAEPDLSAPSAEPPVPSAQPRIIGFEELFGTKLPIWAGGITLAVAGLFIVKYSIDAGLLSPAVRVVFGILFAMALVIGAEASTRWKQTAKDPRIAQALAGAGVATAYASILIATNVYHLIGLGPGFACLALVTGAALALALRFGSPSAVLGLVGGLAAPALVGQHTDNIAPLTAYLGIVIASLAGLSRKQRWPWLTALALVGGFGWGAVLIAFQALDGVNTTAIAGYTLLLAFVVPLLLSGENNASLMRSAAAAIGALQIAWIVMQGGYGALQWSLYGLLSLAAIALAHFDATQRRLPSIALAIGLATMASWSHPDPLALALVCAGSVILFAGSALAQIWTPRGSLRDALQAAAALGGTLIIACTIAPSGLLTAKQWSLLALAAALPLIGSVMIGARKPLADRDPRILVLGLAASILCCGALPELFDRHALPALYALGIAGLIELWRRRPDLDYRGATSIVLLATAASLAESFVRWLGGSLATLAGEPLYVIFLPTPGHALTDLIAPAAILAVAAWRSGAVLPAKVSRLAIVAPGLLGIAGLFILYKQLFAIGDPPAFKDVGLLERVVLDQLLFALGWAALTNRERMTRLRELGLAITAIATARVLLYNALLFDPLWRDQLVGTVPLANLIAPAFLLPLGWLWLAEKAEPGLAEKAKPAITGIQMALVSLFVAATLRQAFHGSLLAVGGVGPGEDISRSLAAIALAIGFLRWGIYRRERPWRIASLVLMLGAVLKVFLVDASGLEGLMRIASFVALGFALIGIGWLYSQHLRTDAPLTDA